MRNFKSYQVQPNIPQNLTFLEALSRNMWWCWTRDAVELFRRIDRDIWEETGHNPVLLLGRVDQARLDALTRDTAFLAHMEAARRALDSYVGEKATWFRRVHDGADTGPLVAYFSAEFGLTECLSIFAGGLGILAGDHLKSASDLGVPVVGVGLLYQQGYFRQQLDQAGRQKEIYEDNDFALLPLEPERRPADGTPLIIQIQLPGRTVFAQVWHANVGRLPLYLLDTNIPANVAPEDRDLTDQLYGGDSDLRLRQEILLGIGGVRALEALGLQPTVFHMNEGHSAFLALERARRLMSEHRLSFHEARAAATAGLVFTTHTPVAAGNDAFPPDLVARYFEDYRQELGLTRNELLGLGRSDQAREDEPFQMSVLALHMASYANGVSRLHGQVSRRMWHGLWPGLPADEVPIGHVTNGVHYQSWISREMNQLYDRYLGPAWHEEPADSSVWERAEEIPPEELWRTHERRRERLIAFARGKLRVQLERQRAPRAEADVMASALNPRALTLGFARRFTAYKRANLLLSDPNRLARMLCDPQRPVQVIFAGKAHPRDDEGKEIIHRIVTLGREEPFRGRLVFLEQYDLTVARYLVQGCDVWLNTPRRPLEASGTSGMKATANGALNLSTLDGWWAEAWDELEPVAPQGGWAIGRGEEYTDAAEQDRLEAEALYSLLEQAVVPTFYNRAEDGLPRAWIESMQASITHLCPVYNTHRMVREYTEHFYVPALQHVERMLADDAAVARTVAAWQARVRMEWAAVSVSGVVTSPPAELPVRESVRVAVKVRLGKLTPDDVAVQLVVGLLDATGEIVPDTPIEMRATGPADGSTYVYEAANVPCTTSGAHGFTVRVLPGHADMPAPFIPGLINDLWQAVQASGSTAGFSRSSP